MVEQPHDTEREILHCAERAHQRLPQKVAHHDSKTAHRKRVKRVV
jgi:hypothetical protein